MPWLTIALIMNLARFSMTDVSSYVYMNWNLFLAVIPLLFVFLFEKTNSKYLKTFYFFAWLFFLPNAAYIVTDLIHLRDVGPEWMLWFDGMMIFAYAVLGIFISSYSILKMKINIFSKSILKQNIFLGLISLVSSFGIYLGRYIRFNTWDILSNPLELATSVSSIISEKYSEPVFVTTIVFFSIFIYMATVSLENLLEKKKEA